jgi:3-hydroxy-9,10-secoandrosta-1,3,5(10)-triene-9,17-dione monooxygenase
MNSKLDVGADLIAKAQALIPMIQAQAADGERAGHVSKEIVDECVRLGLHQATQPKRWGGYEQSLTVTAQILIALARGDHSVAWCIGIYSGHNHHLSMFDERAQQDVWGENPKAIIASPYNPLGTATSCDGGFKLTGKWKYSSGCDYADWYMLGAFVDGNPSDFRTFLVPGSEVEIVDDWEVFGLKGTGSKTVVTKDAHIPEYRTVPFGPGTEDYDFPGFKVNDGPAYRIPYMIVFNRAVTACTIGGFEAMIDAVVAYLKSKISVITMKSVADHPDTQLALGEAKATLDELKILALHDLAKLEELAAAGKIPTEDELNSFRYRAQVVGERCVNSAKQLFELSGGGGLYEMETPIGRIYRNLIAARNHPAAAMFRDSARAIGLSMFGKSQEKRLRF